MRFNVKNAVAIGVPKLNVEDGMFRISPKAQPSSISQISAVQFTVPFVRQMATITNRKISVFSVTRTDLNY